MNTVRRPSLVRRAAVLLLLTAALVYGAALPSWASFSDQAAVQTTVATATVAVPGVPTARATCSNGTATVTVNWAASTAPRVSGYRVRLWLGNAWQDAATVTGLTWTGNTSTTYVNSYVMTFSIWTQTPYGWTAESAHTAQVLCS